MDQETQKRWHGRIGEQLMQERNPEQLKIMVANYTAVLASNPEAGKLLAPSDFAILQQLQSSFDSDAPLSAITPTGPVL